MAALLNEPVFNRQPGHAGELALIVSHHHQVKGSGVGSDKQIVMADGLTRSMQIVPDFRIMTVDRFFQGQNRQGGQNSVELDS